MLAVELNSNMGGGGGGGGGDQPHKYLLYIGMRYLCIFMVI